MKFKVYYDLALVLLVTVVLHLVISVVPVTVLRVILGIFFIIVLPGYSLIAALFPNFDRMSRTEKLTLSLGMSVAVIAISGLVWNFFQTGITQETTLYTITAFVIITTGIAWLRRVRSHVESGWPVSLSFFHDLRDNPSKNILPALLVVSILFAVVTMGVAIASPKSAETFTEFYIVNDTGEMADYPNEMKIGEPQEITVAVINRENKTVTYTVDMTSQVLEDISAGPVTLENGEKQELKLELLPVEATGTKEKITFNLYKDDTTGDPYRQVYYWITVSN